MQRLIISDELLKQILAIDEQGKKHYQIVHEPPSKVEFNDILPNGKICSDIEIQALKTPPGSKKNSPAQSPRGKENSPNPSPRKI